MTVSLHLLCTRYSGPHHLGMIHISLTLRPHRSAYSTSNPLGSEFPGESTVDGQTSLMPQMSQSIREWYSLYYNSLGILCLKGESIAINLSCQASKASSTVNFILLCQSQIIASVRFLAFLVHLDSPIRVEETLNF